MIDAEIVVPAAEAARRAAEDRAAQAARTRGRRRRLARIVMFVVAIVVGIGVLLGVTNSWLRSQWYVSVNGSAGTGTVGVYQGVQGSLVGVPLSSLWSDSGLQVGTLPYFDQELVSKGIPAADEIDAQRIVSELQTRASECQTLMPPAGCPGTTP